MTPPRVALCMIVRDEEQRLPGCLDSVAGLCEERIVVDTGSRDGTVACARANGARVIDFPWCDDFAAARNAGLREAESEWILVLDADERLAPGDALRLRSALEGARGVCGMLMLHDASRLDASADEVLSGAARLGEPLLVPRLFRRTDDLAFEGIVHESVRAWLVRHGNESFLADAHILHYGAVPELRAARAKQDRNTRLLEKRLALEPDDFTIHGYLAHELIAAGESERALAVADAGWQLVRTSSPTTLRSAARLLAARGLLLLRKGDVEEVLRTVDDAIAYEGEGADALFFRGRALEQRAARRGASRAGDLASAEAAYRNCLAWEGRPASQRFVIEAAGATGRLRLATVRLLRGDAADALAHFEAVLRVRPGDPEAVLGACEALLELGRVDEAARRMEPHLAAGTPPDAFLLAALEAEVRGDVDALSSRLAGARARRGAGYLAAHRQALHVDLHCALAAYRGQPLAGPGALGAACSAMLGAPVRESIGEGDRSALVRLVTNLIRLGRSGLVERLLEPAAEAHLPGIGALVRLAVEALGMSVEERA